MTNLSLSVRSDIKDWIDSRVRKGEFANPSDYLSELVERDRASRSEEERIEEIRRMVEDSLASGISDRTIEDIRRDGLRLARERGLI